MEPSSEESGQNILIEEDDLIPLSNQTDGSSELSSSSEEDCLKNANTSEINEPQNESWLISFEEPKKNSVSDQLENGSISRPNSPKKDFDSNTKNSIEEEQNFLESNIQTLLNTNPASEEIMQQIENLLTNWEPLLDDDTKKNGLFSVGECLLKIYNKMKPSDSSNDWITTNDSDKSCHSRSSLTELCEPNFVSNSTSDCAQSSEPVLEKQQKTPVNFFESWGKAEENPALSRQEVCFYDNFTIPSPSQQFKPTQETFSGQATPLPSPSSANKDDQFKEQKSSECQKQINPDCDDYFKTYSNIDSVRKIEVFNRSFEVCAQELFPGSFPTNVRSSSIATSSSTNQTQETSNETVCDFNNDTANNFTSSPQSNFNFEPPQPKKPAEKEIVLDLNFEDWGTLFFVK